MRKSNFIVAAMAMAALVGCQKEFAPVVGTEQAGNAGLDQRPVLASTTLTLGGPETRVAVGSNGIDWEFTADDQVGAMLVDQINDAKLPGYAADGTEIGKWEYADYVTGAKFAYKNAPYLFKQTYKTATAPRVLNNAEEFYDVTGAQIWTNYPYTTQDGKNFTTPATLVEGHYMFYAPYNAGNGTRGPLVVTLPVEQNVATTSQAIEEFYKSGNPVALSMAYLSADETSSVATSPQPIFAYPQFTIVNNFKGYLFDGVTTAKGTEKFKSTDKTAKTYTMKIKQVELYTAKAEGILAYQQAVDATKLDAHNASFEPEWVKKKTVYKSAPTSSIMANTSDYAEATFAAFADEDNTDNEYDFEGIVTGGTKREKRIVLNFGEGVEVKNGESYSFNVVMPAASYTNEDGESVLKAIILVEIDGVEYYIQEGEELAKTQPTGAGAVDYIYTTEKEEPADYVFYDRSDRNNKDIILVRGERYPTIEVLEDRSALKDFAGELLTINLEGGVDQIAIAKATPKAKNGKGIKNNEEFFKYLNTYVNKGQEANATVTEEPYDPTNLEAELTSETFFFDPNHTVEINAEFVKRVAAELGTTNLILATNLPIANNVMVSGSGTEYTFKAGNDALTISFKSAIGANTAANQLVNGINVVTSGTTLQRKNANVTAAVVILKTDATVSNAAGISGIVVDGATLTVTTSISAWIDGSNATDIILQKGADLTSDLNVIKKAKNNGLASINGKSVEGVYVIAQNLNLGTIPAATKITEIKVSPSVKYDEKTNAFEITNAILNNLSTLSDLTISFDTDKITWLTSSADVTVPANIVKLSGDAMWTTNAGLGITVTFPKTTVIDGIEADDEAQVVFVQ